VCKPWHATSGTSLTAFSAFINDETYVGPKVPTLYSVLTTGANATDASVYGVNTNPFVLKYNEVIEIVLNNLDPGKHPWCVRVSRSVSYC